MNSDLQIIQGNCLDVLKTLESESVQCCVTSPPYYGLRNYGVEGQIGLEDTPAEFIAQMVRVFEEVRRVLKKGGTCWLNLGDSYAGSGRGMNANGEFNPSVGERQASHRGSHIDLHDRLVEREAIGRFWAKPPSGWKQKNLLGIPWRVAFALQDSGWWLRQDIIWHKPSPMPESVTDRCTKAHEYIFLLTKSAKYYFDQEAIREPIANATELRRKQDVGNQKGSARANGGTRTNRPMGLVLGPQGGNRDRSLPRNRNGIGSQTLDRPKNLIRDDDRPHSLHLSGSNGDPEPEFIVRNKRSVWTVASQPYSEAHFATFPEKLIEPCILAGSREGDLVLDPFNGSGTTGVVSLRYKRRYLGIELNPEYIELAKKRLATIQPKLTLGE